MATITSSRCLARPGTNLSDNEESSLSSLCKATICGASPAKKVCGHVFQGQLPAPIDLPVIAHHLAAIEEKALQNKLALRVVLTKKGPHLSAEPQPNVTIFKTGRTLFYDFPDLATATKMFDWLLTTNTALEENL